MFCCRYTEKADEPLLKVNGLYKSCMFILVHLTCCSNHASLTIPFVAVEAREHRGAVPLVSFLALPCSHPSQGLSEPAICLDVRLASKTKMVSLY